LRPVYRQPGKLRAALPVVLIPSLPKSLTLMQDQNCLACTRHGRAAQVIAGLPCQALAARQAGDLLAQYIGPYQHRLPGKKGPAADQLHLDQSLTPAEPDLETVIRLPAHRFQVTQQARRISLRRENWINGTRALRPACPPAQKDGPLLVDLGAAAMAPCGIMAAQGSNPDAQLVFIERIPCRVASPGTTSRRLSLSVSANEFIRQ